MDKTKEKGSQHDPEHVANKEETPKGGGPQNAEQCFIMMVDVAALLEQEKAKVSKERFYSWRPFYPLRILNKPYLDRYESQTFAQYDGIRGSIIEHVSKFIDTLVPTQQTRTFASESFQSPYVTGHIPGTLAWSQDQSQRGMIW